MRSPISATSLGEPRAQSAKRQSPVRLAIALDVDDQDEALALAAKVRPYFEVAKVGLELFSAAGPEVVQKLREAPNLGEEQRNALRVELLFGQDFSFFLNVDEQADQVGSFIASPFCHCHSEEFG